MPPARAASRIPLRAKDGSIRAYALVDAEDYERISVHRWSLGTKGYAQRTVYGLGGRNERKSYTVGMHREVLGLAKGDPRQPDHENRNPLDNRKTNLRLGTPGLNSQNRSATGNRMNSRGKPTTSCFRGVCWDAKSGKWQATATVGGRRFYLGRFPSETEANNVAILFRKNHMPGAIN